MVLSYQRQLVVLVSHRHCAGARLASPQTGGHTLRSDGVLSPAPAQHMHTVPWFRLEHSHTQQKHLDLSEGERKNRRREKNTGQSQ